MKLIAMSQQQITIVNFAETKYEKKREKKMRII